MEVKRRPFQGVLNILSFNRHFYLFGFVALAFLIGSKWLFQWPDVLYWLVIGGFLYGLTMPLFVSAYVYDFSGYYRFDWLRKMNLKDTKDTFHLNVNAGFDETSFILESIFPDTPLQAYDFYNPSKHTEQAIVRARKVSLGYPNTASIETHSIPLKENTADTIFLLSAIHEIRTFNEKVEFLKECRRVCRPEGRVIVVEHLRDFPNFLAFTIGFTHFFSKAVWLNAFTEGGFKAIEEKKFTPFMSVFVLQ